MATLLKDLLLTKLGVGKLWIKYSHLVVAHVSGKNKVALLLVKIKKMRIVRYLVYLWVQIEG